MRTQSPAPESVRTMPPSRSDTRPICFKSTTQEVCFVLTATMAVAMSSLLAGSTTVMSASIGRSLHMTTAQITWITAANSLSAGAFLLLFGKIADIFGRKILFIGSLFLFAVFSLASGFTNNPIALDILNGVLGLTSASAVPPAVGLLGACYETSKRKNYAFACFSAGNPLGFAFGALFGGIAATVFNWRASFWLIAIIFLVFAIIGLFTVPKDNMTTSKELSWDTMKQLDPIGVVCIIFGIGMFSAALSLGGESGWTAPYVLALLVVGALLMASFVLWDKWYEYPLVPMHIFRDRNFSVSLAILSLGFMAFIPGSFFLALFFQDVWHLSPIMVAVHLLPMFVAGLIINIVAGMILHKVSNKLLMWIATASYPVAFLLLALNRQSSSYWTFIFTAQIFIVIAADVQFNVCNMIVITSLPQSQQSTAGGILQTAVRLATTLGIAIGTSIFNSVQQNPTLSAYWSNSTQPYTATFLASLVYSTLSLCLVPFLTIGTQGNKTTSSANTSTVSLVDTRRLSGEAGRERRTKARY